MPRAIFRSAVLCLAVCLSGCAWAGSTNERLTNLESAVEELRLQETRLAITEDRINSLSADVAVLQRGGPVVATPSKAAPAGTDELITKPSAAPRKDAPVKSTPASPALTQAPPPIATPTPASSGEESDYKRALAAVESGRSEEGIKLFAAFLLEYPSSKLAPNAYYWLGEGEYTLKRYDKAIFAFKDVTTKYPGHSKAAAAMLKAGYAYERLGDKDNARFYLETLIQDFPGSEPAALARNKLASL